MSIAVSCLVKSETCHCKHRCVAAQKSMPARKLTNALHEQRRWAAQQAFAHEKGQVSSRQEIFHNDRPGQRPIVPARAKGHPSGSGQSEYTNQGGARQDLRLRLCSQVIDANAGLQKALWEGMPCHSGNFFCKKTNDGHVMKSLTLPIVLCAGCRATATPRQPSQVRRPG